MFSYVFDDDSNTSYNLGVVWMGYCEEWTEFIKLIDPNVIHVNYKKSMYNTIYATEVTFLKEEYKTWFILKWS